jgi:SAM-dependent methyltransferase
MSTKPADVSAPAMRDRVAVARDIAESDPTFRLERFCQRYVAEENFIRAITAVEERRSLFEGFMTPGPENAGGVLELSPGIEMPKYYTETEWHLEPGGWDGYDLYGPALAFVLAPNVFRYGGYAAVPLGVDITQHRVQMLQHLPKAHYDRIYEPGCGGVSVSSAIHTVFPDAEIVGSDLSPTLLKNGHLVAERRGIKVTLKQRELLNTGEPDESFDAVVTFALHHELPPKVNIELFKELFRILKPGGDMVTADPPPFRAVDPFQAVILDWDTKHRGEPFFSATLLSDWDEELRKIGFVNVRSFGIGEKEYPWVTVASKPAAPGATH